MKIALGTMGLIAAGLFLAAPNASADALPLTPVDLSSGSLGNPVVTSELGLGSVGVGSSSNGPFLDFGSVQVPLLSLS
ncbi:hypothetical protein [Nocardia sp. NBC_00511]|uniref:hypothetical protein n=1 Tax=Nocardia sp. NBC_00511 TaxID=2903591 RepID=UPI0030DFB6A7